MTLMTMRKGNSKQVGLQQCQSVGTFYVNHFGCVRSVIFKSQC